MADTKSLHNAYSLLRAEYTLQQVQPILDALQLLVELLQDYLQAKRLKYFPFFFTSDRKLIEILSMGVKDLSSFVRSGIIKGVVGITRSHDDPNILQGVTVQGTGYKLRFSNPVHVTNDLEIENLAEAIEIEIVKSNLLEWNCIWEINRSKPI